MQARRPTLRSLTDFRFSVFTLLEIGSTKFARALIIFQKSIVKVVSR